MDYRYKYVKYKLKYKNLLNQQKGGNISSDIINILNRTFENNWILTGLDAIKEYTTVIPRIEFNINKKDIRIDSINIVYIGNIDEIPNIEGYEKEIIEDKQAIYRKEGVLPINVLITNKADYIEINGIKVLSPIILLKYYRNIFLRTSEEEKEIINDIIKDIRNIIGHYICLLKPHQIKTLPVSEPITEVNRLIPRILHQIWLGDIKNMKGKERDWCDRVKTLHERDGWTYKLWTDEDVKDWHDMYLRRQFLEATIPAQKADILRLEILYKFGGVYLDTDMEPMNRRLTDIVENPETEFFVNSFNRGDEICNSVLGSIPHSWIIRLLQDRIEGRWEKNKNIVNKIKHTSGPLVVQDTIRDLGDLRKLPEIKRCIRILDPVFFPVKSEIEARLVRVNPDITIAIHHGVQSWKKNIEVSRRDVSRKWR